MYLTFDLFFLDKVMYARTADIKVDDYSIENGEPIDVDTATVSIFACLSMNTVLKRCNLMKMYFYFYLVRSLRKFVGAVQKNP